MLSFQESKMRMYAISGNRHSCFYDPLTPTLSPKGEREFLLMVRA